MPTEEITLINNMARWFWGISDGSWGSASIYNMLTAMGVPKTEHSDLWPKYNRIIMSPIYRRIIASKYGIDVKHSEVDNTVAQVRFRRIPGFPFPSAFQEKDPKPVVSKKPKGGRDPRFPTPGTEMVKVIPDQNGVMVKVVATEGPNGRFNLDIEGQRVLTSARTISEVARIARERVQGVKVKGVNGFEFFGLGKKVHEGYEFRTGNEKEIAADKLLDEAVPVAVPSPKAPDPEPEVPVEAIKKAFTDAGEFINHRARPSVLWGATLIFLAKGEWIASARGIVAHGGTPEEAMEHWDTVFKTGVHP